MKFMDSLETIQLVLFSSNFLMFSSICTRSIYSIFSDSFKKIVYFFEYMKVIIEHTDDEVYDWSYIEYRHISSFVGKKNLIFTNLERKNKKIKGYEKLKDLGEPKENNIKELKIEIEKKYCKICLLDPRAKKTLSPKDKKEFGIFLFGGILGDNPPRGRTDK